MRRDSEFIDGMGSIVVDDEPRPGVLMRVLHPVLPRVDPNQLNPLVERGRWVRPGAPADLLPSVLAEMVADHENQGIASFVWRRGAAPAARSLDAHGVPVSRCARMGETPTSQTPPDDAIRAGRSAWLSGCERRGYSQRRRVGTWQGRSTEWTIATN
jgi:hypothetical protein